MEVNADINKHSKQVRFLRQVSDKKAAGGSKLMQILLTGQRLTQRKINAFEKL